MNIEEQNFSHLIKRHKTTIYSVCLMFASCQEEANDLMQEVLIKLWNGRSSFKEHCDERGWVWRVAMNTCITQDKRRKRRKKTRPTLVKCNNYMNAYAALRPSTAPLCCYG